MHDHICRCRTCEGGLTEAEQWYVDNVVEEDPPFTVEYQEGFSEQFKKEIEGQE